MRDPRPLDEQTVNRLWNEIVTGRPPTTEAADPTTETLLRLHALGAAPPPASSRERVRSGLQAHRYPQHHDEELTVTTPSVAWPTHPNGVARDAPPLARRRDPNLIRDLPRRLSALAAAALLLAIVGAIVLASLITSRDPGPPVDQPAIIAPATPSPAATPDVTPAATLSTEDHLLVGAWVIDTADGYPTSGADYAIFDPNGTWVHYYSAGFAIGAWRPTGERTAEVVEIYANFYNILGPGTPPKAPLASLLDLTQPVPEDALVQPDDLRFRGIVEVDESGDRWTSVGNVVLDDQGRKGAGGRNTGIRLAAVPTADATPTP